MEVWIKGIQDYYQLVNLPKANQAAVLQYSLEKTALEIYNTKRDEANRQGNELDVDTFLKELQAYLVPSTRNNTYWRDWNNISQMKGGRPKRISEVAITIEKLATRLGNSIRPGAKIQKLLDAMHPQLRKAIKSGIDDRTDTEWPKIVKLAEQHDNVLYDTETYSKEDRTYHYPKTAALE